MLFRSRMLLIRVRDGHPKISDAIKTDCEAAVMDVIEELHADIQAILNQHHESRVDISLAHATRQYVAVEVSGDGVYENVSIEQNEAQSTVVMQIRSALKTALATLTVSRAEVA